MDNGASVRNAAIAAVLAALLAADGLAADAAEPSPRPNIVLIMADNQAPWMLGCYGNEDIRTPHIDATAAWRRLSSD